MERKLARYDSDNNLVWGEIDIKIDHEITFIYDHKEMGWDEVEYAIPDGEKWFLARLITAEITYVVHSAELARLGPIRGWPALGGGGGVVVDEHGMYLPLCVGPHGGVLIGGRKEQTEIVYILPSSRGADDADGIAYIHTAGPVYSARMGDVIRAGLAHFVVRA
jgi:hypothetical protein